MKFNKTMFILFILLSVVVLGLSTVSATDSGIDNSTITLIDDSSSVSLGDSDCFSNVGSSSVSLCDSDCFSNDDFSSVSLSADISNLSLETDLSGSDISNLSSKPLFTTYKITESNYADYFDTNNNGTVISSVVNNGDILDLSGTFTNKTFRLNIPLTLTSISSDAELIDCSIAFLNGSSGANLSNIIISTRITYTPPIYLSGVTNLSVFNNYVYSYASKSFPMYLESANYSYIYKNYIYSMGDSTSAATGLLLSGSTYNNISSNYVEVNDTNGISITTYVGAGGGGNNYFYNNTVHSIRVLPSSFNYAIQLMGSNNTVMNNTIYNMYRGVSDQSSANTIIGNTIYNIHGVWISSSTVEEGGEAAIVASGGSIIKENIIYNCTFASSGPGSGGAIKELGDDVVISNNIIRNCTGYGINISSNKLNTVNISNNYINTTLNAINIVNNVSNVNITNNTLVSNANSGVYLTHYSNNNYPNGINIMNNTIIANTSIHLKGGVDINITGNSINSSGTGILLAKYKTGYYPHNITLIANKISSNETSINASDVIDSSLLLINNTVNKGIKLYSKFNATLTLDIADVRPGEDAIANIRLTAYNILYPYTNNTYTLYGEVLLIVDDEEYVVEIVDGVGEQVINDLSYGNYTAILNFAGDDVFNSINLYENFIVGLEKIETSILLSDNNFSIDYGDEKSVIIRLIDGENNPLSSKAIKISLEDNIFNYNTDGNGIVNFTIFNSLNSGNYSATIDFLGDDDHDSYETILNFTISKASIGLGGAVANIAYGEDAIISVTANTTTATANVSIFVHTDDEPYIATAALVDGKATFTVSDLAVYDYVVDISLNSENYYADDISVEFSVSKAIATLAIDVDDSTYGDDTVVTIGLTGIDDIALTGIVVVTIGDDIYNVDIVDGKGNVTIIDLDAGNYSIEAKFIENQNYTNASANTTFTVNKSESELTIAVEPNVINSGENATIIVTGLVDGDSSALSIYDNGLAVDATPDENGSFVYAPTGSGEHNITVYYPGDENHEAATVSTTLTVSPDGNIVVVHTGDDVRDIQDAIDKAESGDIIDLGDNYAYADIADINITKNLTIVGGDNTTVASADGDAAVFNIVPLSDDAPENLTIRDVHFIAAYYDATFFKATAKDNNGVSEIAEIAIADNTFSLADGVSPATVTVLEVDTDSKAFNPSNTIAVTGNTLVSGMDPFELVNTNWINGSDIVIPAADAVETAISIQDVANRLGTITAVLKDINGNVLANKAITYRINGTAYNTTSDERGLISLTGLNGDFAVVISYSGDSSYSASSATINFTTIKAIDTVIVCKNMTTKAIKAARTGEYFTFSLKDINGKALVNQTVQIGFNGVTYTRTTDENGSARLQVNLKVAGRYTFAVCYLGSVDYNSSFAVAKITVKARI